MTFFRSAEDESDLQLRDSFLFGLIVVGNIIDNVSNPKYLLIFLQVSLSFTWVIDGLQIQYAIGHHCKFFENNYIGASAQLIAAGVVLIYILQVYNWFSKRYI